jgi:hypothetical protein
MTTTITATPFSLFNSAMQKQFAEMTKNGDDLFSVNTEGLNDFYVNSFPEEVNPIFRVRREHDCSCCKNFVKNYGGIVAIKNNKVITIWDFKVDNPHYQEAADKMAAVVRGRAIDTGFFTTTDELGIKSNIERSENGEITWNHLYFKLPQTYVRNSRGASLDELRGKSRESFQMLKRACKELTLDAIDTILELIAQKSLYRGDEHTSALQNFRKLKVAYDKASNKTNFCWENASNAAGRIRNAVIGTLLIDLSAGKDINEAVKAFEKKVAPENYKRPKAIFTKKMVENANKKVKELGFENSLGRRHATIDDITVNNILFADRDAQKEMDVFEILGKEAVINPKTLDKVEEVSYEDFVSNILPNATGIELFLENNHESNLMSLVAPINSNAPSMFKWTNGFSWAYKGDVASSMITDRVSKAGGKVNGALRTSLAWYNTDDLDIHVTEPNGNRIYHGNRYSNTSGELDIDMNVHGESTTPVENVVWQNPNQMAEGEYKVVVHNYTKRNSSNVGFEVELVCGSEQIHYKYNKAVKRGEQVTVARFKWTKANGVEVIESLDGSFAQKDIWGVKTNTFIPVSLVMNSPNHWDSEGVGHNHLFFILRDCINGEPPRGFFNEFLNESLTSERKVFEALGEKMKVEHTDDQLSGVGFSTTERNTVTLKVEGQFSRTIKVKF